MNIDESENMDPMDTVTEGEGKDAFSEEEEKLVSFVNKRLQLMEANLLPDELPTPEKLNMAMLAWTSVSSALNSLYSRIKYKVSDAVSEQKTFEAQAYIQTKREMEKTAEAKGMKVGDKKAFLATKEVEYEARIKYKNAFRKMEAKVAKVESQRSFVERLCQSWQSYQFILTTLSRNMNADLNANAMDYYATQRTFAPAGEN